MYLVTNDPIEYLKWTAIVIGVVVVLAILGILLKWMYKIVDWTFLAKRVIKPKEGMWVRLQNGHTAQLLYPVSMSKQATPKGRLWEVREELSSEWSEDRQCSLDEMRML